MPVEASEMWSPRGSTRGSSRTWKREFQVTGATNDLEVYAAALTRTDYPNPTGLVPVENEIHPLQSLLKVKSLSVKWPGFNLAHLTVDYEIPPSGGDHDTDEDDPLDTATRWRWQRSQITEQIDRDIDRNPFVNSVNEPFEQGYPFTITQRIIEAITYESFYDVAEAENFENTVNSETWTVTGVISVGAGKVRCNLIAPMDEFTADAPYVRVLRQFEIRPDGWKTRHRDEGSMGRGADGKFHPLVTSRNETPSRPALLDGHGSPLDLASYFLGNASGTIANASATEPPAGAEVEIATGNIGYYLRWKVYAESDFNTLGL